MSDRASRIRGAFAAGLIAILLGGALGGIVRGAPAGAPAPAVVQAPALAPATGAPAPPVTAAGPSGPSEDIRDIRGPKYVLPAWLVPVLLAAGALLAYGAWRWHRRRGRPRLLSPFELALQRLEDIRPLMQPAGAREFSVAVSGTVRRYIEQRFDVTATHRTTEEFLHDLLESSNPSLVRHRGLLSEFLHQCDLVKFAGMSLSTQSMESLHQSARAFVLETGKPEDLMKIRQPPGVEERHDSLPAT